MISDQPWHHYTNRGFGPSCKNCGHRCVEHKFYIMGDPCDHCPCDNYEPVEENETEILRREAQDQMDRLSSGLVDSAGKIIDMSDWPNILA